MEFAFTNSNSTAYRPVQGALQDGLKTLLFNLDDMKRPTPNIEQVMEFPKGLGVKQGPETFQVRKI
jgi:hypothetical protein